MKTDILNRSTLANNVKQKKFESLINKEHFLALQKQILPRKALFNVVNICNANCVFCAYQYKEDPNSVMPNEIFSLATEQYAKFHPESYISLTPTVGDPLVDKDIFKKVEIAKKNGIKRVQFYTNAILLKKRMNELLASPLDNIEISLADFDKAEYQSIYRVDKYDLVLDGIHTFLKTLKETGNPLRVDINLRHRRPYAEILESPDYKKFIEPYLTENVTLSNTEAFDNWMGMIQQKDLPEGMKLRNDVKETARKPCNRLFDMQILHTGDVRICGCRFKTSVFDDLVVGNIKEHTLEEIWFSEKVLKMRMGFFDGEFPSPCQNCSFYEGPGEKRYFVKDLAAAQSLLKV